SWDQYLEDERSQAAPLQLFTEFQAFPDSRNGFKVGMRLEGIDPLHPSMFCVLSVAEVIGFRLRLHIDGYSECYDFWVNADAPDVKPAGWCESTGHKLHPPKGYKQNEFNWEKYLEACNAQAAPENLFRSSVSPSLPVLRETRVGMKLEAVDRKNPCLVCVASVADIVDQRFLVHFDNWDDTYDYWCDASSPYIHPVGWCQDHGRPLTAPQGENHIPHAFSVTTHLFAPQTNCQTLITQCELSPHGFQTHMKLEAVDRRNPMLIRVATVADTEDHRVQVHFDGWHEKFDFWVDSDLPDLHPVGWCSRTGHPLEPPLRLSDMKSSVTQGVCPTPGCRGIGHIKGAKYTGHHSAFGCPYSDMNMKKEVVLPDRLGGEKQITFIPNCFILFRLSQSTKYLRIKDEEDDIDVNKRNVDDLQQALHQSVFLSAMSAHPSRDLPLCWEQHCKLLPGVAGVQASRVAHWSVEEVADFIHSLPGCEEQAKQFREEQIDGKAFLLLTQRDIVKIMSMKLGPALKIYNSILMFKHAEDKHQPPAGDT
uniref:L3MBTL histone methyl-lysine binding protein 4 n=1 Tax=Sinocyclocheilus grahami TaxID=75366 RepID=A0A672MCU9_SINGR